MQKRKLNNYFNIALLTAFALFAPASGADTGSLLIARAEQSFKDMRSMTATFTQTVESKGFGQTQKYRGKMAMLKPNMMRWEYDDPAGRLLVVDGERLWFYDPADKTAYFEALKGVLSPNSPALFLAGEAPLGELFKIDLVTPKKKDKLSVIRFRLTPRLPQPGVKAMLLVLDSSSLDVVELLMVDHIGNKNRLRFGDVVRSATVDSAIFTFDPPVGIAVRELSGKVMK